jgi:hypothetical protein
MATIIDILIGSRIGFLVDDKGFIKEVQWVIEDN